MAQETARVIVLAGFAILAFMGVSTLGVMLWLYATHQEVPQGLSIVFTGTAAVTVTTFAAILKAYMDKVTP
jgi:hypothetical protein